MQIICFHNPDEPCGYLSNWYMCDFSVAGTNYTSMEQYMMHQKAKLFGDLKTANKILETNNVRKVKQLGREVYGFNEEYWVQCREGIVINGLYAKFSCNPQLKNMLLNTGNMMLAECAVHDKIWGIGLSMTDPNRFFPEKWNGLNLLGKCLMTVRTLLRGE